ncbi:MAG: deoxyguanosinetriphosphate triphosphohydrolase family protein [Promethearchaeota archaeon]
MQNNNKKYTPSIPKTLVERFKKENEEFETKFLQKFAYPTNKATRRIPEISDYRPHFTRDADRIIHSLSYARFFDKTQVFFWVKTDMKAHRLLHVQLVAKLAREIAQQLKLNFELVDAIALGHDIGHAPFGHDGEEIISNLCKKKGIGEYNHNQGSVWVLQEIEMQNLTLPVVDGILCHNGESHKAKLIPKFGELSWDRHQYEMDKVLYDHSYDPIPKTMEGALVRVVDVISYISRDVMDAENLGILKFEDIPEIVKNILGTTNREIINSLVSDLIKNSIDQPYIAYSEQIFDALQDLYRFNLKNLYLHPDKQPPLKIMKEAIHALWDHYYDDLVHERMDSRIFTEHLELNLKQIRTSHPEITTLKDYPYSKEPPEIIVRDFIAGMTDTYFWHLSRKLNPELIFEPKLII